jgi:hypothetical protein
LWGPLHPNSAAEKTKAEQIAKLISESEILKFFPRLDNYFMHGESVKEIPGFVHVV